MNQPNLLGKVIITGTIEAKTGLSIGGAAVGLDIGGVDNAVIKDQEGRPYVPGSSLKGKMRSLLEKDGNKELAIVVRGTARKPPIRIHKCENKEEICEVCKIFGIPGEIPVAEPTRLIVRDARLDEESLPNEIRKNLDLEWTEVKWENVLDRITSAATPRQMERVPPGARFEFEMIYDVYDNTDKDNLKQVFKAMELLEDDYIGGQGTRGYGKIGFEAVGVFYNSKVDYETGNVDIKQKPTINGDYSTPVEIVKHFAEIKSKLQ